MDTRAYFLHALSPLHAGIGQGIDVIDLPIAREKVTKLPIVPGSTIKGVLRDWFEADAGEDQVKKSKVRITFGPETTSANDHAGSLLVGDARLLCLPVRSFFGTFAWVTAPFVLKRLRRDIGGEMPETAFNFAAASNEAEGQVCAAVPENSLVRDHGKLVLEDLELAVSGNLQQDVANADSWAGELACRLFPESTAGYLEWRNDFKQRFAVIRDEEFSFLYETAIEICTRVHIDNKTGIVAKGQLWWEENLPAESVLWGMIVADKPRVKRQESPVIRDGAAVIQYVSTVSGENLQFGGHATIGRGLCRFLIP